MKKNFKVGLSAADMLDLSRNQKYWDAPCGTYDFSTFRYDDELQRTTSGPEHAGPSVLKLSRYNTLSKDMIHTDTDALASLPCEQLDQIIERQELLLRDEFEALQERADNAQMRMLYLNILIRMRERLDIKPVEHTGNQWVPGERDEYEYSARRSNAVYCMQYRVFLDHEWNRQTQKTECTGKYEVHWSFTLQNPAGAAGLSTIIASQDRKFKSEAEMQKYLDGRIKAYEKFFLEDFPAVPEKYLKCFVYAGQMLPGYREEVQA